MTTTPDRQRIVRVPGARRARLTAVPESIGEPVPADTHDDGAPVADAGEGPNDAQLRRDVPPHY